MDEATRARIKAAWPEVCASLASGELAVAALAPTGLTRGQARHYMDSDSAARAEWASAREESADAFMERALECAMTDLPDGLAAQHARTRIDTLKWAARVRNPRVYSEKQTVDLNVRSVDLTAIIRDANARLAQAREPRLIEQVRDQAAALALPGAGESMLASIL
jgi:hypothetical protein